MAKETENKIELNYIRRFSPLGIFADGTGFSKQSVIEQHIDKYTKHESITDKESYRLSLASARGAISSLSPESQKGMYLFPDGKYNPATDISYILRKDLSIVEIDDYIKRLQDNKEIADDNLHKYIDNQVEKLEKKKTELINQGPKIKAESGSESSSE